MCATKWESKGTGEQPEEVTYYAPTDEMLRLDAACDRGERQPRKNSAERFLLHKRANSVVYNLASQRLLFRNKLPSMSREMK